MISKDIIKDLQRTVDGLVDKNTTVERDLAANEGKLKDILQEVRA